MKATATNNDNTRKEKLDFMYRPIQLKSKEDVDKVVKFASIYPHSVEVTSGSAVADPYSPLGLMSLVGRENVGLSFSDHDLGHRIKEINKCLHKAKIA